MKRLMSFGLAFVALACVPAAVRAQNNAPTFRSESRLVLVDAIVTDKKGAYVTDLAQGDFHVSEDGKDQPIKTFSYEKTPEGKPRQQYTALLFDNRMQPEDEVRARDAATKLIAANMGPNKYFAVINFGTILRITQNFTSDQELLLPAIQGKYLGLSGRLASLNSEDVTQVEVDFGTGTILQGLRSLAKGMARIPGRKTVILVTTGFQVPSDKYYDLQAAIDACNKANVAVYPLDIRGLFVGGKSAATSSELRLPEPLPPKWSDGVYHPDSSVGVRTASFQPSPEPQQGGGPKGGGGGGGASPRPGMLGTYIPDANRGGLRRPPPAVSDVTRDMADPQSVLYALAEGTGGFVIVNSNDIVGGMQKIAQEQSSYYMLGFVPSPAAEGSCHRLKVKVNRGGLLVRSRSTYCTVKPVDMLAGDPVEKQLEAQLDQGGGQPAPAGSQVTIAAPFFYTGANTARVNLALDIPTALLKVEGKKDLNVLGMAYKADGSVAARFSDSVTLEKKQIQELKGKPYHYEKQFPIASGEYTLKVVLGAGADTVGRAETPLKVEAYDTKKLTLSSVALTNELVDLTRNPAIADQAMIEDKTLLVYDGTQFVPSATRRFKRTDETLMYMEIYEPQLVDQPTAGASLRLRYRVLSLDTGATVMDTGLFQPKAAIKPGYPIVPVGLKLLSDRLQPGSYRLVVEAANGAGQVSPARSTDFDVE